MEQILLADEEQYEEPSFYQVMGNLPNAHLLDQNDIDRHSEEIFDFYEFIDYALDKLRKSLMSMSVVLTEHMRCFDGLYSDIAYSAEVLEEYYNRIPVDLQLTDEFMTLEEKLKNTQLALDEKAKEIAIKFKIPYDKELLNDYQSLIYKEAAAANSGVPNPVEADSESEEESEEESTT